MSRDNNSENKKQDRYKKLKTAEIIAESLLDWGVDTIFGLPGDGINGYRSIENKTRQNQIRTGQT
jgi:pyruvate dehydrogenase (quinone)